MALPRRPGAAPPAADRRFLVIRKLTPVVLPRPTLAARSGSYAAAMGIRERVWPGLRPRSIAFEAVVALLGTVAVGLTTGTPDDRLAPLLRYSAVLSQPTRGILKA